MYPSLRIAAASSSPSWTGANFLPDGVASRDHHAARSILSLSTSSGLLANTQGCLGTTDPAQILRAFRHLVALPVVATHLDELASVIASLVGFTPTPVRILDELIWFDWNLERGTQGVLRVVGFPDWGYDTAHDDRGVHQLGGATPTS